MGVGRGSFCPTFLICLKWFLIIRKFYQRKLQTLEPDYLGLNPAAATYRVDLGKATEPLCAPVFSSVRWGH